MVMYGGDRRLLLAYLKALANPTRIRILEVLARGQVSVKELAGELRVSQPRVSWHLVLLRRGGLIERRRVGRQVICELRWEGMQSGQRKLWELLSEQRRIPVEVAATSTTNT
ncbi:MAG: ArsR/SmtB family transcription factor [Candidatus Dormibacteraceae bacterium]